MQQVLTNLLDNAVRFAPKSTAITISARAEQDSLIVEVGDSGPGVPPGEEQRIFEKFYRINDQAGSGSGIGLAICRGVMELHVGKISASNRPGGGAIFRLELPLRRKSERDRAGASHQPVGAAT
jgi:two-component system sensor histidine kinase KdpD